MSFIGDLFGGNEKQVQNQSQTSTNVFGQPYSFNLTTDSGGQLQAGGAGGFTKFSPTIGSRNMQFGKLTDEALGRNMGLIGNLKSNQNPYIQARVRPLEASIARGRADLSRGLNRRGVFGSLSNNELIKYDTEMGRELGDQRALATNEALGALLQAEGFDKELRGDVLGLADNILKQEIAKLGLNLEGLNIAFSGANRQLSGTQTGTGTSGTQGGSDFGSTLRGIASIMGAFYGAPV